MSTTPRLVLPTTPSILWIPKWDKLSRASASYILFQLPARRLSPLQRPRICLCHRPRQDFSRPHQIGTQRSNSPFGQVSEQDDILAACRGARSSRLLARHSCGRPFRRDRDRYALRHHPTPLHQQRGGAISNYKLAFDGLLRYLEPEAAADAEGEERGGKTDSASRFCIAHSVSGVRWPAPPPREPLLLYQRPQHCRPRPDGHCGAPQVDLRP